MSNVPLGNSVRDACFVGRRFSSVSHNRLPFCPLQCAFAASSAIWDRFANLARLRRLPFGLPANCHLAGGALGAVLPPPHMQTLPAAEHIVAGQRMSSERIPPLRATGCLPRLEGLRSRLT